jgi:plasmid rolling circle replication initiator protein Rep
MTKNQVGKVSKYELKSTELGKNILEKVTPKKELNKLAQFYIENHLTRTGNERFKTCGNYFEFLTNQELSVKKVHKASNCGNRFCPICTWNTAKKDAIKISVLLQAVRAEENQEFIMLTLTAPNCSPVELKGEIDKFNLAFKNLLKRRNVKKVVNGYMRKLEITTDQEPTITKDLYKNKQDYFDRRGLQVGDSNPQYNTYNPHFHVILAVNKSYFTDTKSYINRDEWLAMWQECMDDERITQVDVRKVRSSEKSENGAVLEIAKYSAKGNEIYHSKPVFDVFYRAMKGRQLLTYNGLFKEYLSKFKKGELDKYKKKDENEYTHLLQSFWKTSKYENVLRALSKEELEEYNQRAKYIEEDNDVE